VAGSLRVINKWAEEWCCASGVSGRVTLGFFSSVGEEDVARYDSVHNPISPDTGDGVSQSARDDAEKNYS